MGTKEPPSLDTEKKVIEMQYLASQVALVVKNPTANAGDTDLIPGLGRSHMPSSNQAHAPQLLSPSSRARELQQERLPQ